MSELEFDESKAWSAEDRQKYIDNLPEMSLFDDHIIEGDVMVDAMQALTEENETNFSLSLLYKRKGNDEFIKAQKYRKKGFYTCANDYYTTAITYGRQALQDPIQILDDRDDDNEAQDPTIVLSTLYSNRAACHLALKNYGMCRSDAASSIRQNPENVKAYYRGAKASKLLGQPSEVLRYCTLGLRLEPGNASLNTLSQEGLTLLERANQAQLEAQRTFQRVKDDTSAFRNYCVTNAIQVGRAIISDVRVTSEVNQVKWRAQEWPVMFLYDPVNQSDLVSAFHEDEMFIEHLANMFPEDGPFCAWDVREEFRASQLEVYVASNVTVAYETDLDWHCGLSGQVESEEQENRRLDREERLAMTQTEVWLHLSPFCTLRQMLTHPEVVVPGIPMLRVFIRKSEAEVHFLESIHNRLIHVKPPSTKGRLAP